MKILPRTQFGNPILRTPARSIPSDQIASTHIQTLIENMRHTLVVKKLGIALAAPQVGENIALVVVAVRPLLHRQRVESFDMTLINPEITEYHGRRTARWEGCISSGRGGHADLFAKAPRYPKVTVRYIDETGKRHEKEFFDFKAQIMQHEIDHLNGILFVDRVKDPKTYMTYQEYIKMAKRIRKN